MSRRYRAKRFFHSVQSDQKQFLLGVSQPDDPWSMNRRFPSDGTLAPVPSQCHNSVVAATYPSLPGNFQQSAVSNTVERQGPKISPSPKQWRGISQRVGKAGSVQLGELPLVGPR